MVGGLIFLGTIVRSSGSPAALQPHSSRTPAALQPHSSRTPADQSAIGASAYSCPRPCFGRRDRFQRFRPL